MVTVRSLAIGQGQWGLVGRELRVALGLGGILGVLAWAWLVGGLAMRFWEDVWGRRWERRWCWRR